MSAIAVAGDENSDKSSLRDVLNFKPGANLKDESYLRQYRCSDRSEKGGFAVFAQEARSILIAEDRMSDIEALWKVLKEARILNPIHAVHSGSEVVSYLIGEGEFADRTLYPYPVILFLDMVMPWKSGLNTLDWIGANPQYHDFAIIAMTGIGNIDEIRRAYQKGAHSFLAKPPSIVDIMELVNGLKGIRSRSQNGGHILEFDGAAFPTWRRSQV